MALRRPHLEGPRLPSPQPDRRQGRASWQRRRRSPAAGADGSATFDIKFGYTGAYTAAAHGLVAATATDGVVLQDPDTVPFSGDDGGGLVAIDFAVTDTAVARWALSIPGDDDIDLYLFNSAGDLVAQSTNGGTDELIELQLPANDTYTLAVHGWAVADPAGLAFSVQSWMVPVATGGSLSVVGAGGSSIGPDGGSHRHLGRARTRQLPRGRLAQRCQRHPRPDSGRRRGLDHTD